MSELRIFKPELGFGSLRSNRLMTLILVKANSEASYAKNASEKDALVQRYEPAKDLLMLAWTGNYSTDIFLLTQQDLDRYYRPEVSP